MPGHDIIVIGASAGGVETLSQLVSLLPPDLPASLFVVLHFPSGGTSVLPRILSRSGPLSTVHPTDGQAIQKGTIYIAPPDRHLLVDRGRVRVVAGPRENSFRPAVDPLFRTAARAYGSRVVGVVLSGVLDDGTAGLMTVKMRGGTAVVQDPAEALYSGMPRSAIENVDVDHVLPLAEIASLLVSLSRKPLEQKGEGVVSEELERETNIDRMDQDEIQSDQRPGDPSVFGCPECGGTLWELPEGALIRFRCRVGHAWSADSLLVEQSGALEGALWSALRALREAATLARRMAQRARERGHRHSAARFEQQAQDADGRAALILQCLSFGQVAAEVQEVSMKGAHGVPIGSESMLSRAGDLPGA